MTLALSLFVLFIVLMLAVQQYRPWVALGGAGAFLLLGSWACTIHAGGRRSGRRLQCPADGWAGMMVRSFFYPEQDAARLAEELIAHVPDVRWAVSVLALLAGSSVPLWTMWPPC